MSSITVFKVSQLVSVSFLLMSLCITLLFLVSTVYSPSLSYIPISLTSFKSFFCHYPDSHLHNAPSYLNVCHLGSCLLPLQRYIKFSCLVSNNISVYHTFIFSLYLYLHRFIIYSCLIFLNKTILFDILMLLIYTILHHNWGCVIW